MPGSFRDALAARYQAIQYARVRDMQYHVADLVAVYGTRKELARAYAQEYGVKEGSAYKALSRLERVERGEIAPDIRTGSKLVRDRLNDLGQRVAGPKDGDSGAGGGGAGGASGMGGGAIYYEGNVTVSSDDEYRSFDWLLDEEELDELAVIAFEQGEEQAAEFFLGDLYGIDVEGTSGYDYNIDIG